MTRRRASLGGRKQRASWLLALAALGCNAATEAPPTQDALPSGVAALVGGDAVSTATVERIASAQGLSLRAARDRAVTDALFAAAARADPGRAASVNQAERSALARSLLERLRHEAEAAGPPTDDEVRALTEERWPELDRPPSVAVTHAVVVVKSPADDARGHAVALTLAAALEGITQSDAFIAKAKEVPARGFEIVAEKLPPVTPDGRVWDPSTEPPKPIPGASFDLDFTHAASALTEPGTQSGLVKSAFGYHVILLDRRYPEVRIPLEKRREELAPDIVERRAKRALDALEARLKASTPVSVERSAEALTELVPSKP